MNSIIKKCLKPPVLELLIMIFTAAIVFGGLFITASINSSAIDADLPGGNIAFTMLLFFCLSIALSVISVLAGIGGGVIFTPVLLAFTNINSVIVRGTGLIIAMFSGLISTGTLTRKGLVNFRLSVVMTLSQGVGALLGSGVAITMAEKLQDSGEGFIRFILGFILLCVSVYLLFGGKKLEWPVVTKIDRFTQWLKLNSAYYEESENEVRSYKVKNAPIGIVLLLLVGFIGGFFGMGGGWAISPVLNMVMGLPLKAAAANSVALVGLGSCVSIWPYIYAGAIIPVFVLPWLAGQVLGGYIGSHALAKIKVQAVRLILIGIMVYTSFSLVTKGFAMLDLMAPLSALTQFIVLAAILLAVLISLLKMGKKR